MRLRHATTTAVIGETQWNENHVLAVHSVWGVAGTAPISLDNGSVQIVTLAGNVTFNLPTVAPGTTEHLTLILINSETGGHAVTIPEVQWVGGAAPTLDTAPHAKNIIVLRGINGTWIGDGGDFS